MDPLVLFAVVVFLIIVYLLRTALQAGLAGIPGPFLAKFTNLWRLYKVWNWTFKQDLPALHEYYNSQLIRVGPNILSCTDPRAVEIIYGFQSQFKKVCMQTPLIQVERNTHKLEIRLLVLGVGGRANRNIFLLCSPIWSRPWGQSIRARGSPRCSQPQTIRRMPRFDGPSRRRTPCRRSSR